MRSLFRHVWIAGALLAASTPLATAGTSYNFPSGSIIIPTNAAWEDDCGAVSAYGLIYDVLRAGTWLDANGYKHITIYYIISDGKDSPNRCLPTNLDTQPAAFSVSPSSATCTGTCLTDSSWNDGCDTSVSVAAGTPVKQITYNTTSHTYSVGTATSFNTAAKTNLSPRFNSRSIGSSVTTVRYAGAPFVITGTDVTTFNNLMTGTITAQDNQGNNIDFSPFSKLNASGSQKSPGSGDACTFGTDHYVWIHQAQAAFTATINKGFSQTPPRLALLAWDKNNTSNTGASGYSTGGTTFEGVDYGILDKYLKDAGLDFSGASGCPTDGVDIHNSFMCPTGNTNGQIFDTFDIQDLASSSSASKSGLFALDSSSKPKYTMLWTPHWGTTSPGTTEELAALSTISTYLDGVNGASGLMGECASVASFEGFTNASAKGNLQLQTCKGSSSCTGTNTYQISGTYELPLSSPTYFINCTDLTVTASSSTNCAYFNSPTDPYVQVAEYSWAERGGAVGDYTPTSGNMYKPGVVPLVSKIAGLGSRSHLTSYSAMSGAGEIDEDFATRNIKDNTSGKGNVLYMGGHDDSADVAMTKAILLTLLQLGFTTSVPPTTVTEVSRASPIVATVSANSYVFQGTFEQVSPAVTPTTVTTAADITAFSFPTQQGHMRGRTAASISTTGSTYSSGTLLFDAAQNIPSPTYGGCSTPFHSSCRSVFTTTATPSTTTGIAANPANVMVDESNVSTLGPLMVSGLTTAQQDSFIDKILAGVPDGAGGHKAQLGGVDRSTVAVIGSSTSAGTTRPTMAYFGATDGMLHAVCVDATGVCDQVGRELWAFIPRTNLPYLRLNTARVDGSPHVFDAYGDFHATGSKSYRTLLAFQTAWGDSTTSGSTPSIIELDVTDPSAPTVVFEYTVANTSSRGTSDLGRGLSLTEASVTISSVKKNVLFAQTNNGGTGGAGTTVVAIDAETGTKLWQFGYVYPAVRTGGDSSVPATGIPGGAVVVDKTGAGTVTDLVFADLYGQIWELDPTTGSSRYTSTGPVNKPLFSFASDYHSIGATPAIYSKSGTQYAAFVTGGYADPSDTTWGGSTVQQYFMAVNLSTPTANATVTDGSAATYVPFKISMGSADGERGYAQVQVIGNQLFVTTDSSDVNASAYGTSGAATGHAYSYDTSTNATSSGWTSTGVVIEGGAGSLASSGTTLYSSSSDLQTQLSVAAGGTSGTNVFALAGGTIKRALWLRTQ